MSRDGWVWVAIGAAGVMVLVPRHSLALPVEGAAMSVTPHGDFAAPRKGPPPHRHQGLDLVARRGSIVRAIGDGIVVSAAAGLGKIVRKLRLDRPTAWRPGGRIVTHVVYADLGEPLVRPGERVRRGDPIALVASEGFVHFAVKDSQDGKEQFFDPREAGFPVASSKTKGNA